MTLETEDRGGLSALGYQEDQSIRNSYWDRSGDRGPSEDARVDHRVVPASIPPKHAPSGRQVRTSGTRGSCARRWGASDSGSRLWRLPQLCDPSPLSLASGHDGCVAMSACTTSPAKSNPSSDS